MEETDHHQQQEHEQQPAEEPPKRIIPPVGTGKLRRGFMRLRRDETCVQWGFRIIGGTDFEEPITIIKVTRESLAFKKGLRAGDVILKVCGNLVNNLTNEMAKMEILRAGNELDLVIERDLSKNVPKPLPKPKRTRPASHDDYLPQSVNPNLQSRSFNILREALDRMGSLSPSQEGQPIVFLGSHAPQAAYAPPEEPAPTASPPPAPQATYSPPAPQSPQVEHVPYVPQVPQDYEEPAEQAYDEYYEDTAEEDYNGYVAPEVYVPPEERNDGGFATPPEMANDAGYPTEGTNVEYMPHYSDEMVTEPRG